MEQRKLQLFKFTTKLCLSKLFPRKKRDEKVKKKKLQRKKTEKLGKEKIRRHNIFALRLV